MDYFFLYVLTAVMLIRPEDLFGELDGANLYLYTILITAVAALPKLTHVLTLPELTRRPIAVCVLGFFASLAASGFLSGRTELTQEYLEGFFKVALYYFLLIAILDTPERLKYFLGWLVPCICGVAIVASLHYYEVVDFPKLTPTIVEMRTDKETGEQTEIKRALAGGIFGDPNDLSLILTLGILCCVYHMMSTPDTSAKLFWLVPIAPLFFVTSLTGSRGGMLGLLAGFAAIVYARRGMRAGIPIIILGIVALLYFAGGRSADIAGGGTARERLNLWGEGISALLRHPFIIPFGLGPGWYIEDQGLLAHNSFINTYVELGLFGGGFFLVAFLSALWLIDRGMKTAEPQEWSRVMRPAMLGIVLAYAAGCFSLSRHLVLPTYLVLGLATAYISLQGDPPVEHQVNSRWLRWTVPAAVLGLVGLKVLTVFLGMRV